MKKAFNYVGLCLIMIVILLIYQFVIKHENKKIYAGSVTYSLFPCSIKKDHRAHQIAQLIEKRHLLRGEDDVVIQYYFNQPEPNLDGFHHHSQVKLRPIQSALLQWEEMIGYKMNAHILSADDYRHIAELADIDPAIKTVSLSSDYLSSENPQVMASIEAVLGDELIKKNSITVPFGLSPGRFFMIDEMLVVSHSHLKWDLIKNLSISRCSFYKSLLSQKDQSEAAETIAKNIIDWAYLHPYSVFYLPAVKEYCFGQRFYIEQFWAQKVRYFAVDGELLPKEFVRQPSSAPSYYEVQSLFSSNKDCVLKALVLIGYASAMQEDKDCSITAAALDAFHKLSPAEQEHIKTFYPQIDRDYTHLKERRSCL